MLELFDISKFQSVKGILLGTALSGSFALTLWKFMRTKTILETKNAVIVITGCDTGLGYSLALYCVEKGFNVYAGVLNLNSTGAQSLKAQKFETGSLTVIKLDVTRTDDVKHCSAVVSEYLDNNPEYYLHSIINNAGVMIIGEFEWQTEDIMLQQVNVNLLGAMRFTKAFLPLLRKYKGRIVNMSSHCGVVGLPGLSVYAASKSGLQSWNDAVRVEYAKYGIKVISVIPGSFVTQSNILTKQLLYAREMKTAMSEEAQSFYGDYFNEYQKYVGAISADRSLHRVEDKQFYNIFTDALFSEKPNSMYTNSPFRYRMYHFFFRVTPTTIRDRLAEYFVCMPSYRKSSL